MDRVAHVEERFRKRVLTGDLPVPRRRSLCVSRDEAIALFQAQCATRLLDKTSREMQRAGEGFYTIGSSGHEGMAALAHATRPTDMAFLHYRDAAFQLHRAWQADYPNMARDMLLSFAASSDDPISGGHHKVLGSKVLNIPPQTSTIASHLPKAVGAAYSVGLGKHLDVQSRVLPNDAIIVCSFGDASANHSTAQGAINTACWTAYQGVAMPLLFVCEDNGLGISVPTPDGWIEASYSAKPGLQYFTCDGTDLGDALQIAGEAAAFVRERRKPAFLHMKTVRLFGHAGSDLEGAYRSKADIEAGEANDPLVTTAAYLIADLDMSAGDVTALYDGVERAMRDALPGVIAAPKLQTSDDVMASIVPRKVQLPPPSVTEDRRQQAFGADWAQLSTPQPMAKLINWALTDLMVAHGEIVLAGEDIGRKGGVYGVTKGLQKRFGARRVIDTILDEQSILGLGIGMAHYGVLPIPEIQFLAYLHNAEDQLRGEAATLPFFSNGQFANPMVVRIAGLGYQRGFGGHFHNDNSLAVLRDIPGLIVACPSDGAEAAMMLRECVRLAREEQRLVVFVEPIALYPMRDLHDEGDSAWTQPYPAPERLAAFGSVATYDTGVEVAILSYGNGVYLSRKAMVRLGEAGIAARLIDLRWLKPLPFEAIKEELAGCGSVLVVDECRRTGNVSEELMTWLCESGWDPSRIKRVTADDSFIATGPAYAATLPSVDGIFDAARRLVRP
ncbi:MAG: thiamine pyrophosphate-dependent enzyme [Pseudomonadota bacterium]